MAAAASVVAAGASTGFIATADTPIAHTSTPAPCARPNGGAKNLCDTCNYGAMAVTATRRCKACQVKICEACFVANHQKQCGWYDSINVKCLDEMPRWIRPRSR
jgi:hypothetical protein